MEHPDRSPTPRRAQKFPAAISPSESISSSLSATIFFKRLFSPSSSFRRFISSPFMPAYSGRERFQVASDTRGRCDQHAQPRALLGAGEGREALVTAQTGYALVVDTEPLLAKECCHAPIAVVGTLSGQVSQPGSQTLLLVGDPRWVVGARWNGVGLQARRPGARRTRIWHGWSARPDGAVPGLEFSRRDVLQGALVRRMVLLR